MTPIPPPPKDLEMTDALKSAREASDRLAGLAVGIKASLGKLSTSSLTFHVERETAEALLSLLQSPPAQTSDEGVRKALEDLARYAKHSFDCKLTGRSGPPFECTCGLVEARERAVLAALPRGEAAGLHASAPAGCKCADCAIDGEACPDCYATWWRTRHPNVTHHPEAGAPSRDAWAEAERDGMAPVAILGRVSPALKASDLEREGVVRRLQQLIVDAQSGQLESGELDFVDTISAAIALISSGGDHSSVGIKPSPTDDKGAVAPSNLRIGFMCKVDFDYDIEGSNGADIYPTIEMLRRRRRCVDECGIVKVEIRLLGVEQDEDFSAFLGPPPAHPVGEGKPQALPTEPFPVPLSTISDGWRPTHRHVKRGTDYQVIGEARLQQAGQFGPNEGDRLTVYLGADGKLWARATSEFDDGRFMPLPAPPASTQDASPDLSEGDR